MIYHYSIDIPRLYNGLALNERIAKIAIHFHRSGIKTKILFITWSFAFLNAIRISKVSGHYINRKMQYSTDRTAVIPADSCLSRNTNLHDL